MNAPDTVEFSRPIDATAIGAVATERRIAADEGECKRLARRFALLELQRLEAVIHLRRRVGGLITAKGHLSASVVQACVATLEPIHAEVETDFTRTYSETAEAPGGEVIIDTEIEDPDPIENSRIDLGELVAEELALALDPYPRKPGAEFQASTGGGSAGR